MSTESAWLLIREELTDAGFAVDARDSGCRVALFDSDQTVAITRELQGGGSVSLLRLYVTPDGANGRLGRHARFDISSRDEDDFVRDVVAMARDALAAYTEVTHWRADRLVASKILGKDRKLILSWRQGLFPGRRETRREEVLR